MRAKEDVAALLEGIADGTISILCSDHAPHAQFEKEVEFDAAPFGIVGLETELGLFLDILIHKNKDHWAVTADRNVHGRTQPGYSKLEAGTLSVGRAADITLIDPNLDWTVDAGSFQSMSRNTPFDGWKLKGRAVRTMVGGRRFGSCRLLLRNVADDHVRHGPQEWPDDQICQRSVNDHERERDYES